VGQARVDVPPRDAYGKGGDTVNTAVHRLPVPSRAHATCAWCEATLDTIVELLEHVDTEHLPAAA
jgi:hypothetical protein